MKFNDNDIFVDLNVLPTYWQNTLIKHLQNSSQYTLKEILFTLRDMPYQRPLGGNTVNNCLIEWCGTCSGKHKVAYELLKILGYEVNFWMASYQLDFHKKIFSNKLRSLAKDSIVYDIHNFLTCNLSHHPIIIDITFPERLSIFGFPVTKEWNGINNFQLCCVPEKKVIINNLENADLEKKIWLRNLNTEYGLYIREAAIKEMMLYMNKDF